MKTYFPMQTTSKYKRWLEGYLFISPALIGLLFFTLGPALVCLVLAFYRWDFFTEPTFVGLANFRKLSHDPLFWHSTKVTAIYAVFAIPFGILMGLCLALLVNQKLPGMKIFRVIFFMPNIVAGVAMMLVWKWLLNPDFGAINQMLDAIGISTMLEAIGIGRPKWLSSPDWAIPGLVLMSVSGAGGSMIIFLAGLQGIPQTLIEAARIDGAGPVRRFFSVQLPLLTPTIFFLTIVGTIGAMQVFAEAFVMTRGGPANATYFYSLYLYRNAFALFRMGYACSMAVLLFGVVLILTMIQWQLSKRWVHYQ
jgi:multiple sugar transport system permease protein